MLLSKLSIVQEMFASGKRMREVKSITMRGAISFRSITRVIGDSEHRTTRIFANGRLLDEVEFSTAQDITAFKAFWRSNWQPQLQKYPSFGYLDKHFELD